MKNRIRRVISVVAIGLVGSACMKSACDGPLPPNRLDAADQMATCLGTMSVTSPAQMPSGGGATYVGFMLSDLNIGGNSDVIIGDAVLNANFAPGGGSLNGTVSNMTSADTGAMSGNLVVSNGTILGSGFSANVLGQNVTYGGVNLVLSNGQYIGTFYGDQAEGILGVLSGDVTVGSLNGAFGGQSFIFGQN